MNNNIFHVHPTPSASSSILDLQQQLYLKMKDDEKAPHADFPLWLALTESSTKRQRMSEKGIDTMGESSLKTTEGSYQTKSSTQEHQEEFDTWSEDQGTNDDKVLSKEVT
nr:hypothetical protein [Tanacetum cinerariifolium]